jgi:hypothetical protein
LNEDHSLLAVVAHGLVNEVSVISGLLAQARGHLDPDTSDQQRADELLQACEVKAHTLIADLRHYVSTGEPPPDRVIDLDQPTSDPSRQRPG